MQKNKDKYQQPIENRTLKEHIGLIEELAKEEFGLDFFPMIYELVPEDFILEICTYGLPTRFNHWSFGMSYKHQKFYGDMGLSKVYEVVLNSDPCFAFLQEGNDLLTNLLVVAHVLGHSHFFKNNIYFKETDRNMVTHANHHANRIDTYIQKYGEEAVEQIIDIAFAVDNHIDLAKGLYRKKYPQKQVVEKKRHTDEFHDILNHPLSEEAQKLSIERVEINNKIPPRPEKDIIWFLSQYADLEDWQRDIFDIVRSESYYFYPQFATKIINEGFASLVHAEIMRRYLAPAEHLQFTKMHSSVVSPGSPARINPYYMGFKILEDIKNKWDLMYKGEYRDGDGNIVESDITGWQKVLQVVAEENDISLIRNYLTEELVQKLNLFVYGYACDHEVDSNTHCQQCGHLIIKGRQIDKIINRLIEPKVNYGVPTILIDEVRKDGELILRHTDALERGPLDEKYTKETLTYIQKVWKKRVSLHTIDKRGQEICHFFDGENFQTALVMPPLDAELTLDMLSEEITKGIG